MQFDLLKKNKKYCQLITELTYKKRIKYTDFQQQLGALVTDQNCVMQLAVKTEQKDFSNCKISRKQEKHRSFCRAQRSPLLRNKIVNLVHSLNVFVKGHPLCQ